MDLPTAPSICQRVSKLLGKGFVRPALDILDVELNERPDQGELWQLRATILHSQANWQEALESIETASALIPLSLGGELVLADCYSQTGKHELALVGYRHLLFRQPLPMHFYAELYAGFRRAGNPALALKVCRKAVDVCPDNDEAYFGMAHCMSELAFPPRQIINILRKVVELAPDNPRYRVSLAIQLLLTKRREEGYRVLTGGKCDIFEAVVCTRVARQLLELCAWAGDEQRCSQLGALLAKFNRIERQMIAKGKDEL